MLPALLALISRAPPAPGWQIDASEIAAEYPEAKAYEKGEEDEMDERLMDDDGTVRGG